MEILDDRHKIIDNRIEIGVAEIYGFYTKIMTHIEQKAAEQPKLFH